jgi:hypothetical protein
VTTALIAFIIALGGIALNQVAAPMIKAEQEHRHYLRVRAAWQCKVLDPYPLRTRRRRLTAVFVLGGIIIAWTAAVVLAVTFG